VVDYVIPQAVPASIAVAKTDARFPIRRVLCVGRNYAAHAREMGKDPDRELPFFFSKPADAVVPAAGVIPYPALTDNFHFEIELIVALSGGGSNIAPEEAMKLVWGYAVGVDLTRRDIQDVAKQMGRPWDWARRFDSSAPCTPLVRANEVEDISTGAIWLQVNGEVRQRGDLSQMIWSIPDIIAHASRGMAMRAGDLIFTGTPAGVGALQPGDVVQGGVDGVSSFEFKIGGSEA